jgi:hypothetical protein
VKPHPTKWGPSTVRPAPAAIKIDFEHLDRFPPDPSDGAIHRAKIERLKPRALALLAALKPLWANPELPDAGAELSNDPVVRARAGARLRAEYEAIDQHLPAGLAKILRGLLSFGLFALESWAWDQTLADRLGLRGLGHLRRQLRILHDLGLIIRDRGGRQTTFAWRVQVRACAHFGERKRAIPDCALARTQEKGNKEGEKEKTPGRPSGTQGPPADRANTEKTGPAQLTPPEGGLSPARGPADRPNPILSPPQGFASAEAALAELDRSLALPNLPPAYRRTLLAQRAKLTGEPAPAPAPAPAPVEPPPAPTAPPSSAEPVDALARPPARRQLAKSEARKKLAELEAQLPEAEAKLAELVAWRRGDPPPLVEPTPPDPDPDPECWAAALAWETAAPRAGPA